MNYFASEQRLIEHENLCSRLNDYKITFPKYEHVEFRNFTYKQHTPFVIYADFESILQNLNNSKISEKTRKYQKHVPFSAGYYLKCGYDDSLSYFKSYRGVDCMQWFVEQVSQMSKFIYSKFKHIVPLIASETISLSNVSSTHCHICEKPFTNSDKIVRDHDHFTGKFRNFAHQSCNLNYRKHFIVPVVFHNLSGYDIHFVIRELAKHGRVSVLPVNKEKYISITYREPNNGLRFRFIDSLRFLGASLDELVSTLNKKDLLILKKEFSDLEPSKFQLLTQKGVFCYDYINDFSVLNETSLPSIDKFYNKLNDEDLSDEKFAHAQNVWHLFKIQNLGEYSDLYLKTDILLLADVFENFRKNCIATHKLDPAWYHSMPGYTWDSMLQFTKCRLDILRDIDQIMFVEQGIRGGISVCVNGYAEANNKYMDTYDVSKES